MLARIARSSAASRSPSGKLQDMMHEHLLASARLYEPDPYEPRRAIQRPDRAYRQGHHE